MSFSSKKAAVYLCLACILAVILSAADIFLMSRGYDWNVHYYSREYSLPALILHIITAASVIILLSAVFVLKNDKLAPIQQKTDQFTAFFSIMTGALIAAFGFYRLYEALSGRYIFRIKYNVWGFIAAPLAIIGGIFFIITSISKEPAKRRNTIFIYFLIAFLAMMVFDAYFSIDTPLNCPPRIIGMIGLLSAMNYMLYEVRFLLGIPMPARYIASSAAAVILCSISFIPLSVFSFIGKMKITSETLLYIAGVTFTLYIAGRSLSYLKIQTEEKVKPTDKNNDDTQVSKQPAENA
jgi:hypothetical protein